jgi:hypothetical protein
MTLLDRFLQRFRADGAGCRAKRDILKIAQPFKAGLARAGKKESRWDERNSWWPCASTPAINGWAISNRRAGDGKKDRTKFTTNPHRFVALQM